MSCKDSKLYIPLKKFTVSLIVPARSKYSYTSHVHCNNKCGLLSQEILFQCILVLRQQLCRWRNRISAQNAGKLLHRCRLGGKGMEYSTVCHKPFPVIMGNQQRHITHEMVRQHNHAIRLRLSPPHLTQHHIHIQLRKENQQQR